ncbi:nucleotide exchange factor GrpE [Microbispora amethystogenes]|uniref:Protein GrpE n=1 Tax=Microbispora amethystogenes TaxID=1427754 RepID=A0ABQ4FD14_9ACTN|nr:nucleotide exchange factor GrpE [Microbispora amethystogenes]GIH32649.1 protein GrpE [Microbispora amethystogenes]
MSPRENGSQEEPVIRDNRKIDPETGRAREATTVDDGAAQAESASVAQEPEVATAEESAADLLAERTGDLQRLQAEFSNYRKRVERDRITVKEQAVASVLTELLPVLDDIGRARDHGELTGGFAKVSESLETAVGKLGLTAYGTKGDPFDPTVHEALLHSYSAEVTEPTCVEILQPGYRINDRILRPARVAVAEPSEEEAPRDAADDSGAADGSDEN